MSSLTDHAPRLRANASTEKLQPENGFTSPPSSSSRRPPPTPPISPEGLKYRPTGNHRPQISIEHADDEVPSAAASDQESGSTMHGSHSSSICDVTDPGHPVPSLDQNISSFTRQNGCDHQGQQINSHLLVRPRAKKSNTLPNELAYMGYSDNQQSEPSSVYNSSEAECDSDGSSVILNPRELLHNEKYWRNNMLFLASSDKLLRQETFGGLEGKMVDEIEEDEEEGPAEDGYDEMDEYMSNSEASGDELSGSTAPSFAREPGTRDDEVFRSDFCGGLDQLYEADSKLVDWSYNVFVPACRTLLLHCKDGDGSDLSSGQVLADLRSLSNTISFFCSEQQRLSTVGGGRLGVGGGGAGGGGEGVGMASSVGGHRRQGISASISTDRISRIRDIAKAVDKVKTDDVVGDQSVKTASLMSSDSNSSSGFESQDNSYDRSYSVKILRSVSQSLIAPLIEEAEDGFTQELYKSIVQAVQKIAWKVEACLAINNPTKETDVYMKIFDQEQQENLTEKMINALPPEEPKLAAAGSRSNSVSLGTKRTTSNGRASLGLECDKRADDGGFPGAPKMSPSALPGRFVGVEGVNGRNSTSSNGRDSTISMDLTTSMCSETTCNSSFLDSRSTSISEDNNRRSDISSVTDVFGEVSSRAALMDIPPVRRDRVATFASPSRSSKAWHSFDEHERDAKCRLSSENLECSIANEPHYFRPKHVRRTTVSLSRKEVSKLGWKVAKRAEKSSSALSGSSGAGQDGAKGESTGSTTKSSVRRRAMHRNGNSSLSELKEVNASNIRTKSASTSNLLDDAAASPNNKSSRDTLVNGEGASVPKRRKSRNRSYDAGIQCTNGDEKDLSITLKHQSSIENTSLNEHLARSYLPVCKQTSMPGVSSSIEDGWTFVTPDPSASLDPSAKRLRSGSRNSKVQAAKTFSRKAKKAVVDKGLSASEKFTNKVIKTAIALRRGSISTFAKGRKDDVFSVSSAASMDELHEEMAGGAGMGGAGMGGAGTGGAGGLQAPPTGRPPRPSSTSEPPSPHASKKKSGTMPNKRGTLSRLSNKAKTKSFGSSQSLPRRSKKGSQKGGFTQVAPADQAALTDSIYTLSKNAVQPSLEESEDQLHISVEMAGKAASRLYRKRSSIISSSSSSSYIWFEITVTTNMKQFGRKHYTIVRNLKQVNYVYDTLIEDRDNASIMFPEKPDKKMTTKVQVEKVEAFLVFVATMPMLLTAHVYVDFLRPDEGFGTSAGNSETKLDLLMTFYTPGVYPGPPGSHQDIQQVNAEDVPDTSSPARPKHQGTLQKKGTFTMVRNQEASSTFVIKEEGQDALIVSCEEEKYMVVAGTFEKLVEQMACEENPDARFVMTFLLGYRHFSTPMVLLTELLKRFHMTLAPDPTEEEVAYAEKWRYVIQLRVLDVIMYWIKKCWPDFYRDPAMLDGIRAFIDELKVSKDPNFHLAGTTLDKMLTDKLSVSSAQYRISTVSVDTTDSASSSLPSTPSHLRTTAHTNSARTGSNSPGPSHSSPSPALHSPGPSQETDSPRMRPVRSRGGPHYSIHTLPAIQLARQLTLVELEYLKAIDIHEMVVYVWEPNSAANKPYRHHIDEYISRFNKLSYWVSSEVCCTKDPQARGALIEKFIEVAKYCQDYKNFNSTISIVSGLSLMAVRRLKKSWEFVSDKSVKTFHKMCQVMNPTNNHSAYRKLLGNTTRKDCIPYFGVFMRDITFFNDGNHKKLKNGLLNFSKLRSMVAKFEELKVYQRSKFLFTPDEKLQDYCRNLWCLSEQELYDASENVEPREVAFPAAISTPTTPADSSQQFDETDV